MDWVAFIIQVKAEQDEHKITTRHLKGYKVSVLRFEAETSEIGSMFATRTRLSIFILFLLFLF